MALRLCPHAPRRFDVALGLIRIGPHRVELQQVGNVAASKSGVFGAHATHRTAEGQDDPIGIRGGNGRRTLDQEVDRFVSQTIQIDGLPVVLQVPPGDERIEHALQDRPWYGPAQVHQRRAKRQQRLNQLLTPCQVADVDHQRDHTFLAVMLRGEVRICRHGPPQERGAELLGRFAHEVAPGTQSRSGQVGRVERRAEHHHRPNRVGAKLE